MKTETVSVFHRITDIVNERNRSFLFKPHVFNTNSAVVVNDLFFFFMFFCPFSGGFKSCAATL